MGEFNKHQLNEHQKELVEDIKKSSKIGKIVLIASGFTGAGSTALAKTAVEKERGITIVTKEEPFRNKLGSLPLGLHPGTFEDFVPPLYEINSGKMNKKLRNKNNPGKIKSKFNGKSNPFKKKP